MLVANQSQTQESAAATEDKPQQKPKAVTQQPVKKPKVKRDKNVTTAIAATVIIVLGLAVLAVYAYLKQR